jgi:hypothetical protein
MRQILLGAGLTCGFFYGHGNALEVLLDEG